MLSYQQAFYDLKNSLQQLYDAQEAAAIAHEVLYHITRLDKLQRIVQKEHLLDETQEEQWQDMKNRLLEGIPMQYVLQTAWFMGRPFYVNKHVLIPRPETEELVQWIVDEQPGDTNTDMLDIGTGSGCIPVSLKLGLPQANITSCDVSNEAIVVALKNAHDLHATVHFLALDFLNKEERKKLPQYNVIVSNPPYIPGAYRAAMDAHVKDHEPSLALFVPDNDPLLFYKAIAVFGLEHLKASGAVYCELHTDHATETQQMFIASGYTTTEIRKDMHGNLRMLKAGK